MATIDIRKEQDSEIDLIKFSSDNLFQSITKGRYGVYFCDSDGDAVGCIDAEEDAKNLIKALEKAIELGWWK